MKTEPHALPPARRTLPAMLERQAAVFGYSARCSRIAGAQWVHADAAARPPHLAPACSPRRVWNAATAWR